MFDFVSARLNSRGMIWVKRIAVRLTKPPCFRSFFAFFFVGDGLRDAFDPKDR